MKITFSASGSFASSCRSRRSHAIGSIPCARNASGIVLSLNLATPITRVVFPAASAERRMSCARVGPQGEYAQSVLGRERIFEHASHRWGTKVAVLRLNYAIDLRYGVLVDIARTVFERRPVDLRMPLVNIIWQGDSNSVCMRSIARCASPPFILNLTGPETLSTRWIAEQFAQRFGHEASFTGEESSVALLNNAAKCHRLFGYPTVTPVEMMDLSLIH